MVKNYTSHYGYLFSDRFLFKIIFAELCEHVYVGCFNHILILIKKKEGIFLFIFQSAQHFFTQTFSYTVTVGCTLGLLNLGEVVKFFGTI